MNRKIGTLYKLKWPWWYLRATVRPPVKAPFIPLKSGDFSQSEIVLSFVGDMMGVGHRHLELSPELKTWIGGSTHFCFNLESLVSASFKLPLIHQITRHYHFYQEIRSQFPKLKLLANLANNHIDDLNQQETDLCFSGLSQLGVQLFGSREVPAVELAPRLKLLGATTWYTHAKTRANCFDPQQVISDESFLLYLHAGDEFRLTVNPELVDLESKLPANVLALLGHHTHTPLPIEKKSRFVAWSLGNFCIAFGGNPVRYGEMVKVGLRQKGGEWEINAHQWSFLKITPSWKKVKIELVEHCPFYQKVIVDKKES
jgi:hypothetical protein